MTESIARHAQAARAEGYEQAIRDAAAWGAEKRQGILELCLDEKGVTDLRVAVDWALEAYSAAILKLLENKS